MRLHQTRIRKYPGKEIRATRSPLKPFTVRLKWHLLQLKGCMTVLQEMCAQMGMPYAMEMLKTWQSTIEFRLREAYQVEKQKLIDKGLYPKDGMFDQRNLDRIKRREL